MRGASALAALQHEDHAVVVTAPPGSSVPSGGPRSGTLLSTAPFNGKNTVYVVGTDGELHAFASTADATGDGYDQALVVDVPSLEELTVGSTAEAEGAAADALATSADGAIVDSAGTHYIFAGGRAFSILSAAALVTLEATDPAQVVAGAVTNDQQNASLANGVLLDVSGISYVSYGGNLWPFESQAQLASFGYGGTGPVPVPGTDGVTAEG